MSGNRMRTDELRALLEAKTPQVEGYGLWCPSCGAAADNRCRCMPQHCDPVRHMAGCPNGHRWPLKDSLRVAPIKGLLAEKHHGVRELSVPADCDPDEIIKAAERDDLEVDHGGNHDSVRDAQGRVITQVPRHQRMNPNTCRAIVKALKKAVGEARGPNMSSLRGETTRLREAVVQGPVEKASDADLLAALKAEVEATLKEYVGYEIEDECDSEVPVFVNGRSSGSVHTKQGYVVWLTGFEADPTADADGFYCDWYPQWTTEFSEPDYDGI